MTTANVAVTEGSGKNVATYSITEDAATKQIQRVVLNTSAGAEVTQTTPGQTTAAASLPVVLASDDARGAGTASTALRVTLASDAPGVADGTAGEYETVAASQTTQTLGATGAIGDYLEAVLIVPTSTSPGEVLIKDGSDTAISIFKGGSSSITDLAPIYVPLGLKSRTGVWAITTGSAASAIGIGNFT